MANTPKEIANKLLQNDAFSKWLGIEIIAVSKGYCKLKMKVRKEMLNGFAIAHGGITYSFADTCLAFASNSNGKHSMSVETSISHIKSCKENEILFAESEELNVSNKIAVYQIVVKNQKDEKIAFFKGICYVSSREWE